jgi:hypothetical protein
VERLWCFLLQVTKGIVFKLLITLHNVTLLRALITIIWYYRYIVLTAYTPYIFVSVVQHVCIRHLQRATAYIEKWSTREWNKEGKKEIPTVRKLLHLSLKLDMYNTQMTHWASSRQSINIPCVKNDLTLPVSSGNCFYQLLELLINQCFPNNSCMCFIFSWCQSELRFPWGHYLMVFSWDGDEFLKFNSKIVGF